MFICAQANTKISNLILYNTTDNVLCSSECVLLGLGKISEIIFQIH
jgi:hypothetical protein